VVFFPDGKWLASAADDNTVKIWNAMPQPDRSVLSGHANDVRTASFTPDGKLLATGSFDHSVRLWDVATRNTVAVLEGHDSPVGNLAFSSDGKRLATADFNKTIKLWDLESRRETQTLPQAGWGVGFSDEQRLIAGDDNRVGIWTFNREVNSFQPETQLTNLVAWAFDNTGRRLAKVEMDGLRIIEVPSGREMALLNDSTNIDTWNGSALIAFSPDTKTVASVQFNSIKLWDISASLDPTTLEGHSGRIMSIVFSHNGRLMASGAQDHTVRLWDVPQKRLVAVLRGHSGWVSGLTFSPDAKSLVTCSNDGTTKLWSVAARREVTTLFGASPAFSTPLFSPDGNALVAFGTGSSKVRLWLAPATEDPRSTP
jgi:WD40 repeat protein